MKSNHSKPGLNLSSIYNIAIHLKMHLEIVRINGTVKNLNRYTLLKNFSQANVETVDTLLTVYFVRLAKFINFLCNKGTINNP